MYEDQHLFQFLVGLNEDYDVVRGHILMIKPLPFIDQAYHLVFQNSQQKEFHPKPSASPTVFAAFFQEAGSWAPRPKNDQKGQSGNSRNRYWCEHCKMNYNMVQRCFKLHGYPPGFQPRQRGQGGAKFVANTLSENDVSSSFYT